MKNFIVLRFFIKGLNLCPFDPNTEPKRYMVETLEET